VRTKNVENKPVINERDTRPVQKPHFAAVAVKAPRGPAANIPTGPLPPIPMPARDEVGHDEVSPLINAGGKASGRGRRPSLLPQPVLRPNSGTFSGSHRNSGASTATTGMSEAEMDEKVWL
jgi:kinesin family protein 22